MLHIRSAICYIVIQNLNIGISASRKVYRTGLELKLKTFIYGQVISALFHLSVVEKRLFLLRRFVFFKKNTNADDV